MPSFELAPEIALMPEADGTGDLLDRSSRTEQVTRCNRTFLPQPKTRWNPEGIYDHPLESPAGEAEESCNLLSIEG